MRPGNPGPYSKTKDMKTRLQLAFAVLVPLSALAMVAVPKPRHESSLAMVQGYYHLSAASPCILSGICESTVSAQVCTYMGYQLFGKAPDNTCTIRLYKLPD